MTVERMIELLEIEKECVLRNASGECNRYCAGCDLLQDDTELHEMYTEAIALLKAREPRLIRAEDFMGANGEYEPIPCWKEPKSPTRREGWAVIVYGKWLADKDVCRYWTGRPDEAQKEAEPWND